MHIFFPKKIFSLQLYLESIVPLSGGGYAWLVGKRARLRQVLLTFCCSSSEVLLSPLVCRFLMRDISSDLSIVISLSRFADISVSLASVHDV